MLKICPRAHAESFQNQLFFDIPIQRGFEGNFCAHLELLQQRPRACEGHHPLQKMTPSAHRRGRCARMSKSFQTHCHFNTFQMRSQENIWKLMTFSSKKSENPSTSSSSAYPCASVVATVVRMPRSEVSERHRAGSWVWVVARSRLDIW